MFDFYSGLNAASNSWDQIELMYSNLDHFTTPGYKTSNVSFEEMMTQGVGLGAYHKQQVGMFTQGRIRQTGNSYDLAIQESGSGSPCSLFFVLSEGGRKHYTRAGHFELRDGKLIDPASHWSVQGFALDGAGNKKSSSAGDMAFSLDPQTKLYGGMYTGFSMGEGGKLYGETRISDPLTGQTLTKKVPLFQVALASFTDPGELRQVSSTLYEASDNEQQLGIGIAGEGTMAASVQPKSLEMSNVSLPAIAQNIILAQMQYNGEVAAFKSLAKMVDTATALVR